MILEDPLDDPADLPVPNRSPEPTKEQLDVSDWVLSGTIWGQSNAYLTFQSNLTFHKLS